MSKQKRLLESRMGYYCFTHMRTTSLHCNLIFCRFWARMQELTTRCRSLVGLSCHYIGYQPMNPSCSVAMSTDLFDNPSCRSDRRRINDSVGSPC